MFRLALYKYKEDIQKISFTLFLKQEKNMSLSEAKFALDKLLEGVPLLFTFKTRSEMQRFKRKSESLGVIGEIIDSPLYVKTPFFSSKKSSKKTPSISNKDSGYSEFLMLN